MSCFFCNSSHHVSPYCDVYKTDEERQKIVASKKCCQYCFASVNNVKCTKCRSEQKCFICFSLSHCTIYCPHRFNAPTLPKIDEDLFDRFGQLLNIEEKYLIAFSFPHILPAFKLKHIKVNLDQQLCKATFKHFSAYNFFVAEKASMQRSYYFERKYRPSMFPVFYIAHLEIQGSPFHSQEFLLLLSSKTKILSCGRTEFQPTICFHEILQKAPKLENIDISDTNIDVNNLWPENLLLFNSAKNFSNLYLSIPNVYFNVESLAALMMKTSATFVKINLFVKHHPIFFQKELTFNDMRKHFSEYFIPSTNKWSLKVSFLYKNGFFCNCDSEYFALKM